MMIDYRPIYWQSPSHFVGENGTHLKDCYVEPSLRSRFMAWLHRVLRKRDPFFHREDYL